MGGALERERMLNSLRSFDADCCEECDEGPDAEPAPTASKGSSDESSADDEDFDDSDDDGIIAKMRAARMRQMRSGAEAEARRRATLGTHARLQAERLVGLLADGRDDASSPPLVLVGISSVMR